MSWRSKASSDTACLKEHIESVNRLGQPIDQNGGPIEVPGLFIPKCGSAFLKTLVDGITFHFPWYVVDGVIDKSDGVNNNAYTINVKKSDKDGYYLTHQEMKMSPNNLPEDERCYKFMGTISVVTNNGLTRCVLVYEEK